MSLPQSDAALALMQMQGIKGNSMRLSKWEVTFREGVIRVVWLRVRRHRQVHPSWKVQPHNAAWHVTAKRPTHKRNKLTLKSRCFKGLLVKTSWWTCASLRMTAVWMQADQLLDPRRRTLARRHPTAWITRNASHHTNQSITGTHECLRESSDLNRCIQDVAVQTNPLATRTASLNVGEAGSRWEGCPLDLQCPLGGWTSHSILSSSAVSSFFCRSRAIIWMSSCPSLDLHWTRTCRCHNGILSCFILVLMSHHAGTEASKCLFCQPKCPRAQRALWQVKSWSDPKWTRLYP